MCEDCRLRPQWETDYLSRYLEEQTARLEKDPGNEALAAEIMRTRALLDNLAPVSGDPA